MPLGKELVKKLVVVVLVVEDVVDVVVVVVVVCVVVVMVVVVLVVVVEVVVLVVVVDVVVVVVVVVLLPGNAMIALLMVPHTPSSTKIISHSLLSAHACSQSSCVPSKMYVPVTPVPLTTRRS